MAFSKKTWVNGDIITADLLNALEQVVSDHDVNIGDLSTLTTTNKTIATAINELKSNGVAGKSAYQIWLDAGNTGTNTDFLNSLKGAKGDTGAAGASGSGAMVFNTLTDLQSAYPSGSSQPAWVIADNEWYYWSGSVTGDVTPPNNVTNLVTSSVTQTTLTLSWTASTSSDIASYDVYNGSTLLGNVTGTNYNVTTLTANTAYTFTVKAKDTTGNIATGTSVNVTTLANVPSDVTNLTTSNITATSLSLTWTASSGATSYDIYNGSTLLGNTISATYNVTGLTASTQYTFKVVSKNAGGSSSGATVTVTTTAIADTTPPNPVTNLVASTVTSSTIPVSWTLSSSNDVVNYEVAYSSDGGNNYTVASNLVNASSTSYTVTGLTASTAYIVRVVAIDGAGNKSTPITVNATTTVAPDTTSPVVTSSLNGGTYTGTQTVTLTGTDDSGVTPTIYYTTDNSNPTTSGTKQTYSTPISISTTTTLKYYAVDGSGNASAVQTQIYTINAANPTTYLQMNGTTDWLRLPSMTFDQVVMDVQLGSSTNAYILDARTGIANGQVMNGTNGYSNWGSGISSALKDGVAMNNVTNGTFVANERHTYTFNYSVAGTDNINIFSANNVDSASNTATVNNSFAGNIYDIKLYSAGTLVAHYDFTTGSLNDQTGTQGKALLTGGTWNGVTQPTVTQYLQLNGTTDYVRIPNSTQLQLTNNFKIQIKASLANLTQTDKYLVSKNGKYSVHEYVSAGVAKSELYVANFGSGSITSLSTSGTVTIPDTNAHTITYQYDGTTLTTTLDGTNVYSGAQTFTLATDAYSLYIGAKDYQTSFLAGNIYDVQIFNVGTLVAHYDFTKGSTVDQSGNGNNGILTGGTWVV